MGRDDMLKFVVDIFDYDTGESVTMNIAGYLYQTTGNNEWVNCTVTTLTRRTDKDYTVRFGADGTNNCLWIGEINSTWSYPQVIVRDFYGGYTMDVDLYDDNWDITFVTEFDTVDETLSDNLPTADWDRIEGKPTIPSGNQIIDWTTDQGSTNIHSGNYTNTTYSAATTSAAGLMSTTDKTKLDGIEAGADVTDAIAISAAGAMLKSGAETSTAMKSFEANLSNQDDWVNSPVSILERGNIGTTSTDNKYSPNLNFHWRSRVSNSLWMNSSGILHYGSYGSTGVPAVDGTFKTGTLYAGAQDITATKVGNWNTAYTHSQAAHAPSNAEQNVQSDWNATSGDAFIQNKPTIPTLSSLGALSTSGGTMTGALNASGGLYFVGDTNMGFVPYPIGAQFRSDSSNHTGYIKIKLPTDITNSPDDMVSFHVDIYDYTTNEMISVFVGGYTYRTTSVATYWYNCTAIITAGKTDKNFTVRFGNDGTNYYVAIGETTSTWAHPSIIVRDVQCSYRSNVVHYVDGWDIDITTAELEGVDETRTDNFPVSDYNKMINAPSLLEIGTTATTAMAGNTSLFDGNYSSLSGIPSTFAPSSHNHDDLYHKLDFATITGAHSTDAKSGTWSGGAGTSWGSYKPGDDSTAGSYYNDGTGYAQYNIPSGYTTAYIGQLKWSSGGYFDVYAVDSSGNLVLRGRYMSLQSIENTNHAGNHDYQQIIKISGLDGFSSIRIQNRTGRLHLQGIGWTKEEDTDSTADALSHWDLIYGKPATFAPSSHSHSDATTSAAGFMSSTDKTKLDGIESSADVTDAINVSAAGALMKTGGGMTGTLSSNDSLITGFFAPQNPEGSHIKAPWFFNDIAYARLKGATVSVTVTGGSAASNATIDAMLDASTGYGSFSTSGVTSVVIEMSSLPKNFTYGTHMGITFGNTTWRAKNVVLESYYNSQWNTLLDVSNQSQEYVTKSYNSSSSSQTKLRWTLSNFNAGTMRIVSLFCYNYNAVGMPSLFMPLNGGTMYGNLTFNSGSINLSAGKIYADTTSPTAHIQVGAGTTNTGSRSGVALLGESVSGGVANALGLVNTATGANSNGVALNFHNGNAWSPTGQIIVRQNSTGTATDSAMQFYTYDGGLNHRMSIKSDGTIRFNAYSAGLIASDANGNLSVDTSTYLTGIANNSVGITQLNLSDGSAGQVLTTDGAGNLSFTTVSGGSSYTLPAASSSALGGVKIGYTSNAKNYPVQLDASNKAYVNVPWTDANTTYSAGSGLDLTSTTFSVEPDLRDGITHVGKDANNYITFDSANGRIDFYAGGVFVARMESDGDLHIKGDVIAFSNIFS
jgi:hypothetical protein